MLDEKDELTQEDVVVIEQRDKKTLIYIAIAFVLGGAIGGLIGSSVTQTRWQNSYHHLEEKVDSLNTRHKEVIDKIQQEAKQNLQAAQADFDQRLEESQAGLKQEYAQQLAETQHELQQLQDSYAELQKESTTTQDLLDKRQQQVTSLNRQADMQSAILGRSKALFQKEYAIKQELAQQQKQRESLVKQLDHYQKACNTSLNAATWNGDDESCDKQDAVNAKLNQLDQLIEVNKMDLKQIEQITQEMGVE